jgi:hypothetical protein
MNLQCVLIGEGTIREKYSSTLSQDHLDVFICLAFEPDIPGRVDMDECALVTVSSSTLPTGRQDGFVGSYMG